MTTVSEAIKKRHSARAFLDKDVDIDIVKNGLGQAYLPEWNFNGIGDFNSLEGYLVKVNSDVSLDIIGDFVIPENSPLYLDEGWSIISYLRLDAVSADLIFQDLLSNNNLIIAKNNLGAAYLPEWSFNGIGNLTPGQGYQIKLNQSAELVYFSIFLPLLLVKKQRMGF